MKKRIALDIPANVHEKLKLIALKDKRTISNTLRIMVEEMIETLIENAGKKQNLTDGLMRNINNTVVDEEALNVDGGLF